MTVLSAVQVADYWVGAGGPRQRAVEWVAIAIGESGFDDSVVSSAGAIGLWQIMPFNAPAFGFTSDQLFDPAVNARVAVLMSGGGTNCAAWDSCYLDINRSGRYTFLSFPEQGSADWNNLTPAAAQLQGHGLGGIPGPPQPTLTNGMGEAVTTMQTISGRLIPAQTRALAILAFQVDTTYRQRWRG